MLLSMLILFFSIEINFVCASYYHYYFVMISIVISIICIVILLVLLKFYYALFLFVCLQFPLSFSFWLRGEYCCISMCGIDVYIFVSCLFRFLWIIPCGLRCLQDTLICRKLSL